VRTGWLSAGALSAVAIAAGPAMGDDSTAGLASGGLVFLKSTQIEMQSETLYISNKAIRVHYAFVNRSPTAVTATMAFPMPDVTIDGPEGAPTIPRGNSDNFLGFTTTADGKTVKATLQQTAVSIEGGVDRTAYLRSLGVPLAVYTDAAAKAINALSKAKQDALVKLGLALPFDQDVGNGMEHMLIPTWTVRSRYVWSETFAPGRSVTIEHDYTPSVATTVFVPWETDPSADARAERTLYCVDGAFAAAVAKLAKGRPGDEEHIDYVLVTGANWKGPIGDFRMTVDKGAADNLVSFCGSGVTKTGPTTFEVHYKNFTPTANVSVLLIPAHPQPTD
jgi:hypothetical protein